MVMNIYTPILANLSSLGMERAEKQQGPTNHKRHAAKGSHRAKSFYFTQGQYVQAPREQQNSDGK